MTWKALGFAWGFGLAVAGCSGGGALGPADPSGVDPTDGPSSSVPPTSDPDPTFADAPTWHADIAPLLADRCGNCHAPGGIGPFSVLTYADVVPWGEVVSASIASGSMPPFFAVEDELCDMTIAFQDDISLTEGEKQLVYDWVAADMPEGDPATAAPTAVRPVDTLAYADVELELQEPFVVDGTDDVYQCFRIPIPADTDKFLTALEVVPGNDKVVHHVLVWNDPYDVSAGQAGSDGTYGCSGFPDIFPTELVGTWTPGVQPVHTPPGTGTLLTAGGSLVLNVHYHPTGTTSETDRTKIRIQWTDDEPDMYATWYLIDLPFGATVLPGPDDEGGAEFRIPAGVPDHLETVQMWFTNLLFTADMTVFAITPHMHYLGTDMWVTIDHTDDAVADECLVHTPGYRFDWQRDYTYDAATGALPVIHPSDRVQVHCMYDNSPSNPFFDDHLAASGQDAAHDVWWGEETGDEMCMAIVGLIVPKEGWSPFSWF